jgi:uncharacterized membrane protein HdeD (DUF308 family)
MLSDALHHAYNRARWGLLFRGLIALALGVFIIARTLESVAAFALVIAIWALVTGVFHIVDAIELRSVVPHWWLLLISGLVSVGFGVAALYYYPVLSLTFAVIWTAYWLLLSGFLGIYVSVQERKLGTPWLWTLAFGILSILAGVYAIAFPPATLAVIMSLIAAFAIVGGIVLLFGFFRLTSARSQLAGAGAPARA